MKRDLDVTRSVLLALEAKSGPEGVELVEIEGQDEVTIKYHLLLLAQAGLIDYEPELTKTGRIIRVIAFNPSWEGHEFLDATRDPKAWAKLKQQIGKLSSLPFEIVKALAIAGVKSSAGL